MYYIITERNDQSCDWGSSGAAESPALASGSYLPPQVARSTEDTTLRTFLAEEKSRRGLTLAAVPVLVLLLGYLAATNPPLGIAALVGTGVLAIALLRPAFALYFLVAAGGLPLNFVTGGDRSVLSGLGGSTVSGVLLVLYVAALAVLLLAQGQLGKGLAVFAIPVTWAAWSVFTLVYTDWLDEGIRLAFKIWYPLLVGMMAYFVCLRPSGVRNVRTAWYVGYAVTSTVALVRLALDGLSVYASGEVYRYSSLNHPSPFSFYMLVTFVFAFSLWNQGRRRLDALVAATAALQVVLSMTRISIGSLVLALLVISLLQMGSWWKRFKGLALTTVVASVILGALITFPVLQGGVFFKPVSSVGELFSDSGNLNTQGRDVVWAAIIDEYGAEDMLSGRGLGSSTRFLDVTEARQLGAGVVHSEYLRVLYEQGLVGLLWFVGILVASALYLGKRARRAAALKRALLSAACVATVMYATISITDNSLDYYSVLGQYVVILAAMGLALRAPRSQAHAGSGRAHRLAELL